MWSGPEYIWDGHMAPLVLKGAAFTNWNKLNQHRDKGMKK